MSARTFAVFLAVLAVVGLLGFGLLSKGDSRVAVGDPVPDKRLPTLDGKRQVAIADLRGRWVLVNLWASWCPPCRSEAPTLERFARSRGDHGVAVVGINVQDNSEDALAFLERYPASYPQLRSIGSERSDAFGTLGVPENFLVDPNGRVALVVPGPVDEQILEEQVIPVTEGEL